MIATMISAIILVRPVPLALPRWWQIGLLATLLQIPVTHWGWTEWLLRATYLLLLLVAWANRNLVGGRILCAGLILNSLPILIYGRMPMSEEMAAWGQLSVSLGTALPASKDVVIGSSPLLLLSDIIPMHLPGWRAAWSIGDVLLCVGMLRYSLSGLRWQPLTKASTA